MVFPAASRPSINSLISFDPKILPIILENWAPIVVVALCSMEVSECFRLRIDRRATDGGWGGMCCGTDYAPSPFAGFFLVAVVSILRPAESLMWHVVSGGVEYIVVWVLGMSSSLSAQQYIALRLTWTDGGVSWRIVNQGNCSILVGRLQPR